MTKLCKDCKWYRKDWMHHIIFGNQTYDMCASPNTTDDLVTGRRQRFCDALRRKSYEREYEYLCGPDGKYWEAK